MKRILSEKANEMLLDVAKKSIITEVEKKGFDKISTLIPFGKNVSTNKIENGYIITITNLPVSKFLSHFNTEDLNDAQSKFHKLIYKDAQNLGCGEIVFELDVENDNLNGTIKILKNNKIQENHMKTPKKKKTIVLSETKLINMIERIVLETKKDFKVIHTSSKNENEKHLKEVTKKINEYLSFDGNDNPEFPKQIGKGEKKAHRNRPKEEEFIENFRGEINLDLDYDTEPSEEFTKKNKMYLKGDPKTGNLQDPKGTANTVKSELGEKMIKTAEKKKEIKGKKPMYIKDPTPIGKQNKEKDMLKKSK